MSLKYNPREYEDVIYASVLADGKIHVSADKNTEGAVEREYETSDGKKGSKWELVFTELSGIITKIRFHEGQYGINLQLTVTDSDDDKPVVLSLPTESNFGEDMMKKLPNVDLEKEVMISPFSFEAKGKKRRGVTVTQKNKKGETEKIENFYFDADKKVVINDFPAVPKPIKGGKPLSKSVWRKYFAEAREFLVEDIKERLNISEEEESSKADDDFNNF